MSDCHWCKEADKEKAELTSKLETLSIRLKDEGTAYSTLAKSYEEMRDKLDTMKSERDELARQIACLKVDIAGRSEIVLIEQHEKEVALLQVDKLRTFLVASDDHGRVVSEANKRLELQVESASRVVEAARTLIAAEKERGEAPFQLDCLLNDLRKAVEGYPEKRKCVHSEWIGMHHDICASCGVRWTYGMDRS